MFGTALRLMAVGEAGRRLGDYVKNLTTRYLVLSTAGIPFAGATVFATLAAFWAINTEMQNPIWTALIMAGILVLAGFLIVLTAYGITREKPQSVSQALRQPVSTVQHQLPTVEDVGRQIEVAVQRYGAVRVAVAAAAGGVMAGLLAKRFRQI
jgi:hypothetical protein